MRASVLKDVGTGLAAWPWCNYPGSGRKWAPTVLWLQLLSSGWMLSDLSSCTIIALEKRDHVLLIFVFLWPRMVTWCLCFQEMIVESVSQLTPSWASCEFFSSCSLFSHTKKVIWNYSASWLNASIIIKD